MKFILLSFCLMLSLNLIAQDKFYTKDLANGYGWTASPSESMLAYTKGESLSRMINIKRYQTQDQRDVSFPLWCEDQVEELLKSNTANNIDLQIIEEMIDEFYTNKERLIIPVLGAYCCCIKKLAGVSSEEIERYRQELFKFSKEKLKQ